MALEREIEVFERNLPDLLADPAKEGGFVLVGNDKVVGVYPDFDVALAAGYDKFGLTPFLVREVTEYEVPKYFSRNIRCHS